VASFHRDYFDAMYATDPDPWGFETRWYEARKYSLTMAALPEPRYSSAFEPGCSVGVLTSLLADRCDRLLATDIVPTALRRARERIAGFKHVTFDCAAIPESWPNGPFDLVVLSEIAYYFDTKELKEVVARLLGSTSGGATVIAVHWRGETNYPLTGEGAHRILNSSTALQPIARHLDSEFVLDVWRRLP
jgi:trans-aconitate methyltransferase